MDYRNYLPPYELEKLCGFCCCCFLFCVVYVLIKREQGLSSGWIYTEKEGFQMSIRSSEVCSSHITIHPSPFFSELSFCFLGVLDLNHQVIQALGILSGVVCLLCDCFNISFLCALQQQISTRGKTLSSAFSPSGSTRELQCQRSQSDIIA